MRVVFSPKDVTKIALGLMAVLAVVVAVAGGVLWGQLPGIGAGGLLHPARHVGTMAPPAGCAERDFAGAGVTLRGWQCTPAPPIRGTIVYLHGIADNRTSSVAVIQRFVPRGFRVVAYDSRSHGRSDGEVCTYGFYEKSDLHRVIDTLPSGPVILFGTSLGAAVGLQEAADDPRVTAVVAVETFSDLRTVATERAPFVFTRTSIDRAFALAEDQAHFRVDDVSPVRAAARITAPVLLIHGAADVDTPPAHSERVRAALRSPSELMLVPGAHHNESLNCAGVWARLQEWIERSARLNSTTPQVPTPQ
jgi:pimeloyl-ACP methyl ester carboxylesterase